MKVILNIKENIKYTRILKEVKDKRKGQFIVGLADAFNDVKLYE